MVRSRIRSLQSAERRLRLSGRIMTIIDRIRRLFGRGDELIPLPEGFDSQIFSQVMVRAETREQQAKVMRTALQLAQLWKDGDQAHLPRAMVMVEATYPHLERMADLEVYGSDWLSELAAAMQATADSADDLVWQSKETAQLLRDALDKSPPD